MGKRRVPKQGVTATTLWDIAHGLICDSQLPDPFKSKLLGYTRSRNFKGICDFDLPNPEFQSGEFLLVRQLKALFSKNAEFAIPDTCASNAKESFLAAETRCRITNKRLDWYYINRGRLDPDVDSYITKAESYVRRILGDLKPFIESIPDLVKITGGATEDRSRRRALPFLKISRRLRIGPRAVPLLESYLSWIGNRQEPRISRVSANRVVFVPKNWKTHRTIACEPTAMIPFQLAGDAYIKRRLSRWGVDLSDQTKNQELARLGSIDGSFATIDLASASDSLSVNTLAWLLPEDWFVFLMRLRSDYYTGEVGKGKYAKYASMGNGLTFVLETLVFYALARGVGSKRCSVYGDDITIESEYVTPLLELLRFFGFSVNHGKTFTNGPFRESCGADWLNGRLVTPFYVRQLPKTQSELSHFVNGLVKVSLPYGRVWKILKTLSQGLARVPESSDSGSGIHIPYTDALAEGLVVYNSKAYGPWVVSCKAYVPVNQCLTNYGARSYLVWLLFRTRVRKDPESTRVSVQSSDYTTWPTGSSKRVLRHAPVQPWSSSCQELNLWAAFSRA